MRFDRLFVFLMFLLFTLMIVATAIETCWWWRERDKQLCIRAFVGLMCIETSHMCLSEEGFGW